MNSRFRCTFIHLMKIGARIVCVFTLNFGLPEKVQESGSLIAPFRAGQKKVQGTHRRQLIGIMKVVKV